jgi:hypothetical protein
MDSFSGPFAQHPLGRAVCGLSAVLDEVQALSPAGMSVEEKAGALVEVSRQVERLQGLRLALMAAGEDVAAQCADRDVACWLAPRVQADPGPTRSLLGLAEAVDRRWIRVGAAVRAGGCSVEQAKVIVKALDQLPAADLDPALLVKAEEHLVDQAALFAPRELRRLAEKILEVIAPEIAEEALARQLERELQAARRKTRLSFKRRGDGTTDITAKLPDADAARLKSYLDAFTSPRHLTSVAAAATGLDGISHIDPATGARLPADRLRGHAFVALLERLDPHAMPVHGGNPTSVNVTVSLKALLTGLGIGTLDDGTPIPLGEVRRLACTAGIIPVVLGGKSEVLDLGRTRRFFTGAQHRALALTHPTCRAEGCTIPATWCEAHHAKDPWAHNGRTDLKDGKLLCNWHHHRAHDERYETTELPNGDVRYTRRR